MAVFPGERPVIVQPLALGVDLGTSGLRLSLLDREGTLLACHSSAYPLPFTQPEGWRLGLVALVRRLPAEHRAAPAPRLTACVLGVPT